MRRPLYEKEELRNRQVRDTVSERDLGYAEVGVRGAGQKRVKIAWDFSEAAKADGVCRIQIGKEVAFVDANQMMKYLRWV